MRRAPLRDQRITVLFFLERDLLPTRRPGGKCGGTLPVRAGGRSPPADFFTQVIEPGGAARRAPLRRAVA